MLSPDELKQIADLMQAKNAEQQHCDRKHRYRRRLIVVSVMMAGTWAVARILHFEQAHEAIMVGIDGFVACNIDKFIYGIA